MTMGRRVSLLVSISVVVAVALTSLSAWLMTRISLYDELDEQLTRMATTISPSVAADPQNLGGLEASSLAATNTTLILVRADGQVATAPGAEVTVTTGVQELAVARTGTGVKARTVMDSRGVPVRIVAIPFTSDGVHYALVAGQNLTGTKATLGSLWIVLVGTSLVGIVLTAIAGYVAGNSATRPLRDLSRAVHRVTATDELSPIPVRSHDELGDLTVSFNAMLSSLSNSRERQKQLIADASHELRTPLTSMRTNVELLIADQNSHMLPDPARSEILDDVAAQLGEFSSLIGDLVQLSREDAPPPRPQYFDLSDVISKAVERGRRRGPNLEFDVHLDSHPVLGDEATLERAVTNLLDNAVKFSPTGGTVTVTMDGDTVVVSDEGPGIDEADLPHIFDRFYRSDQARNTPGTGLGLSIVAHTVTSHQGWIKASRAPGGGAMFTMYLPREKPPAEESTTS
ncbi:HAMP domain-containing sensor histidine kinase [Cutibacterium avidum]|uniref:sensor histidine kinase n=1 Tax=Cutibacterium avidum TaxID=33010 RepID=UPI00083E8865|nr:HAMP domain-containing sensor histidine kinase [Cutibacterium avidum]AOG28607.1 two-component sensor histidine kinase [Cutibacterium avidum]MDU1064898.1 HAMP domain-containing sensor histidine kinase [Cutibacterium avidum]